MSGSSKPISKQDSENTLRYSFNDSDKSITTSSFVTAKVGHKITRTDISATTEDYSYFDGSNLLYTIRIVYTSSTKETLSSVERIA